MTDHEVSAAPPMRSQDWDRFEIPEPYRAEIIQGELVVTSGVSVMHGRVQVELGVLLDPHLPARLRKATSVEWRFDSHGVVVMAPQPDLIVIDHKVTTLDSAPVLAAEILSPFDARPLERSPLTRIEGKRLDYADRGLTDYLEIDLSGPAPTVIRYELHDGSLTEVARISGSSALLADRPFPYSLIPDDLVR